MHPTMLKITNEVFLFIRENKCFKQLDDSQIQFICNEYQDLPQSSIKGRDSLIKMNYDFKNSIQIIVKILQTSIEFGDLFYEHLMDQVNRYESNWSNKDTFYIKAALQHCYAKYQLRPNELYELENMNMSLNDYIQYIHNCKMQQKSINFDIFKPKLVYNSKDLKQDCWYKISKLHQYIFPYGENHKHSRYGF
ncbi:hypothetical protein [Apilactobacillus timberlakei]|uniref:hypothetical protein n=1 Tax=Apilactobacillus timberlakei TaxID=2008380 RepID=UPI00112BBA97|nr:hypothetical protein [Apilactobacillus timberlakei]TPR21536.1 hypothetical protein DY083_05815 [Apilactobacillus timberlakei]